MNKATATFTLLNSKKAIVDINYEFSDGRQSHIGFHTVEVDAAYKLYDACYQRADAQAESHNCRLERFSQLTYKPYRIHFTNFGYFHACGFITMNEAKQCAVDKCFECTIYFNEAQVMSWSPISGFRALQ
jgi:hypothetical protein